MAHRFQPLIDWLQERKYTVSFEDDTDISDFWATKYNETAICSNGWMLSVNDCRNGFIGETSIFFKYKNLNVVMESVKKCIIRYENEVFRQSEQGMNQERRLKELEGDF